MLCAQGMPCVWSPTNCMLMCSAVLILLDSELCAAHRLPCCAHPLTWVPSLQVEETLNTLSYATRTKNIHNRPTVQYDPREAQISLLRREIELLRQENTLLKEQLRAGTGAGVVNTACWTAC